MFLPLWKPNQYKVFYGGRGGAKSWSIARALIWKAHTERLRILCAREIQTSIRDSVHRLLCDQIESMGLALDFEVIEKSIRHRRTGTEFIFEGLHHNSSEVKSKEGIDVCWVEEAEKVSADSWGYLLPTIRKAGSEVWVSFNPEQEDSATAKLWLKNPPPGAIVVRVSWRDNPYFTKELETQRLHCLKADPDAYDWIWEGGYRKISEATIFRNRVQVHDFEAPYGTHFRFGADFGFANDPSVLLRMYITGAGGDEQELWIDYEAYGWSVEIDDLPRLYDTVPESRKWPIKGDCSRPETISYLARRGFNISAAEKWPGSVEDGIQHLKGFKCIHIHTRCTNMQQEARLYSWKIDKPTGAILPIPVDAWNHGWDSARYGLDGFIQGRGGLALWARLGREEG